MSAPTDTAALPGGGAMPLLGLGTWRLKGEQAYDATAAALEAGYRHLDTATMYRNEKEVGEALTASGVPREQVFVATKLPPDRVDHARLTIEESLELLGVERLDLWLLHAPPPGDDVPVWREMVAAREAGLTVDVGVSNYSLAQVDALAAATGVTPAVNQIRWSPLLHDPAVLAGHRERGVVLEGYSGLKGGTLEHPAVTAVAERLDRTPAQVVVRWHLQHGIVVIPKSAQPERIAANADVDGFTLTPEDMAALDAAGR